MDKKTIQILEEYFSRRLGIEITYDRLNSHFDHNNLLDLYNRIVTNPEQHILDDYVQFFKERYAIDCSGCHSINTQENIIRTRSGEALCTNCSELAVVSCSSCGNWYLESDYHIDYYENHLWKCLNCMTRTQIRLPSRRWTSTTIGKGTGEIVQSARGWSVEIECYLTSVKNAAKHLASLPTTFGVGQDASLRNSGLMLPDGRSYACGIEITTPILKGIAGENYLKNICRAINKDNNAEVDLTCGLHIHIDMSDCKNNVDTLKRILAFHWIYEPVIMALLPSSRRTNKYTKSLKNDYHYKKILKIASFSDLRSFWYKNRSDRNSLRRYGINFYCLFEYGHLEIRYHSGTTNSTKMQHWANLHTRIIDYCNGMIGSTPDINEIISNGLTPLGRARSVARLTEQFCDSLQLSQGTKEYIIKRQLQFKNSKTSTEIDFVEKEAPESLENESDLNTKGFNRLENQIESNREIHNVELSESNVVEV